jgi:hypothetical protein
MRTVDLTIKIGKHMVVVEERESDYHANILGYSEYWDAGRSPSEAIGNLIRTHPEMFQC